MNVTRASASLRNKLSFVHARSVWYALDSGSLLLGDVRHAAATGGVAVDALDCGCCVSCEKCDVHGLLRAMLQPLCILFFEASDVTGDVSGTAASGGV